MGCLSGLGGGLDNDFVDSDAAPAGSSRSHGIGGDTINCCVGFDVINPAKKRLAALLYDWQEALTVMLASAMGRCIDSLLCSNDVLLLKGVHATWPLWHHGFTPPLTPTPPHLKFSRQPAISLLSTT